MQKYFTNNCVSGWLSASVSPDEDGLDGLNDEEVVGIEGTETDIVEKSNCIENA